MNRNKIPIYSENLLAAMLGVTVAVVYALLNLGFAGPAYLDDEIGYLLNAAALNGSKIDGASSYHFGYSLFLVPSFFFFEKIELIWRAVQFTNAALFGLGFFVLYKLSKYLLPEISQARRVFAVVLCSLGPLWLVMSGYAFPSSAITLIFVLSLWFLIRSDKRPAIYLCLHGFLIGFLYWIHPTGLAIAIASVLSLLYMGALKKEWKLILLSILIIAVVIITYRWLQPVLLEWMTPDGMDPTLHYPSINLDSITFNLLWSAFVRAIGQITYITIGTLGFGLVGIWVVLKMAFTSTSLISRITGLFMFLSLIGLVTQGSLMFSLLNVHRTDQWIYGRYLAVALLPILLLGFMSPNTKGMSFPSFFIPALFLLLSAFTIVSFSINHTEPGWGLNLVNIPAFWVIEFPSSYGFAVALMIGAAISAFALLLPKKLAHILVAVVFILGIKQGFAWHSVILAYHSRPSSIPEIIKLNWPAGACIALDPATIQNHGRARMNLYGFHLHDYQIRRMPIYEWAKDCDGPFITSDFDAINKFSGNVLAREIDTGLFLVSKRKADIVEHVFGVYPKGHICTALERCVVQTARDLNHMSLVGTFVGERLNSDGRSGFLFFGPYVDLSAGRYKVKLEAEFINREGGYIEVVTAPDASIKIAHVRLVDLKEDGFEFELQNDATHVQVRLVVSDSTKLSFSRYSLVGYTEKLDYREIGYPIIFGYKSLPSTKILHSGWHALEDNHVWSKYAASLNIPIPDKCVEKFCKVKLNFSTFGASPQRPVSVYFSSADHDWNWSEKMVVTSDISHELTIPISGTNGRRRINTQVPKARSPKYLGVSSDERILGVSLQRIELVQQ